MKESQNSFHLEEIYLTLNTASVLLVYSLPLTVRHNLPFFIRKCNIHIGSHYGKSDICFISNFTLNCPKKTGLYETKGYFKIS